jgi:hypothetical protein
MMAHCQPEIMGPPRKVQTTVGLQVAVWCCLLQTAEGSIFDILFDPRGQRPDKQKQKFKQDGK